MRWSATRWPRTVRSYRLAADGGLHRAGGDDRLGRQPPGEHRLADALAGHRVGGHRRVAGEQHPPVGQRRPVDAGRDRPGRVPTLERHLRAERVGDVRPRPQVVPQRAQVGTAAAAVAQHAVAEVHPAVGQREAPRVAGQQIGLEPHVQVLGCRPGHVAGVLAERVPLAEVAGLGVAEQLAHRRPHPVGGDEVAGGDGADAVDLGEHEVVSLAHAGDGVTVAHLRAGRDGRGRRARRPARAGAPSRRTARRSGSRSSTSRPDGERSTTSSTGCQFGTVAGSRPSSSSSRSASVVRPSPQHLSRGNVALSTTTTCRPPRARSVAAVEPAGPPPTTSTSQARSTVGSTRRGYGRRLGAESCR